MNPPHRLNAADIQVNLAAMEVLRTGEKRHSGVWTWHSTRTVREFKRGERFNAKLSPRTRCLHRNSSEKYKIHARLWMSRLVLAVWNITTSDVPINLRIVTVQQSHSSRCQRRLTCSRYTTLPLWPVTTQPSDHLFSLPLCLPLRALCLFATLYPQTTKQIATGQC